jgi:hypothetical protein
LNGYVHEQSDRRCAGARARHEHRQPGSSAPMSLQTGSGSGRCGASDSGVPVAAREIQHPNNQEKGCPSVGGIRKANDARGGRDKATGNTRDPKGAEVAVLPWIDQALHAGSRGRCPPPAKTFRSYVVVGCLHRGVRSCSLQEPRIERREHQDNSDVYHQALPEPMPEEQDVHGHHDGYQREHVKHDACLPSHPSTLLLEDRRAQRRRSATCRALPTVRRRLTPIARRLARHLQPQCAQPRRRHRDHQPHVSHEKVGPAAERQPASIGDGGMRVSPCTSGTSIASSST